MFAWLSRLTLFGAVLFGAVIASGADWSLDGNPELAAYFESQVAAIEQQHSLLNYRTLDEWEAEKDELRTELHDMLGLHPLPERTPLNAEVTRVTTANGVRVENIHFQSMPGLYVTGNLYLPAKIDGPLPTVLYVCGHGGVKRDGISYGNKTHYTHHGSWFARNGYACLTIDTLQLGEIEGIHHGTYRYNRWWWNGRGYTSAGVEAWNCMRALDYLETRKEIDAGRFGVTGRSGGGAYSWWIAAADERINCAVPVAGIATLRNHVVDGCVEGHCDCMFMVNTHRWDYAKVAALVAPRPLLISNSDKDRIFPLEGVIEIHRQVRHIYELYDKGANLGLQITEGPHKDTQELRIHAFRWMNRWLRDDDSLVETTAVKMFDPPRLRVFVDLPKDERNTAIDEDFVPAVAPLTESDANEILYHQRDWKANMLKHLRGRSFASWPDSSADWSAGNGVAIEDVEQANDELTVRRMHFESEKHVQLSIDLVTGSADTKLSELKNITVVVADDAVWQEYSGFLRAGLSESDSSLAKSLRDVSVNTESAVAVFCPRGQGGGRWVGDDKKQTQIRRRFQMIGTTVDAARVWDIRRAIQVLSHHSGDTLKLELVGNGNSSGLVLTASLFESGLEKIRVDGVPELLTDGPIFLNSHRFLDGERLFLLGLMTHDIETDGPIKSAMIKRLAGDARWHGRQWSE